MNQENKIAEILLDMNAVGFVEKPIEFKSGMLSPVYTDNRMLPFHPDKWEVVIEGFKQFVTENNIDFDIVAGVEAAGIPHSAALGYSMKKPSVFVRKQVKEHGTKKMVEGGDVTGKKVLLVEDLITTGGSSLKAVESLRNAGAVVNDCLVIINYGFPDSEENYKKANVKLHALAPFPVLLEEAIKKNLCSEEKAADIKEWLSDPWAWTEQQK